jgi:hypothetical protein
LSVAATEGNLSDSRLKQLFVEVLGFLNTQGSSLREIL